MIFANGKFFLIIQVSSLLLAVMLFFAGGYHIYVGEFLFGATIALLGVLIFLGASRLKMYSFQIASLVYLTALFAVLINIWLPPLGASFSLGPGTSMLLVVLLLMLAVGSVCLARSLWLSSRRSSA